jgi:formylglycine-generating enzyme required for sulfatase activity
MAIFLCCGAILPAYGQDAAAGQLYEKGATWTQTLLAARAKYLAWDEQRQAAASVTLGPWFSSGPLKAAAFTEALFPEQGVVLDAKAPDGKMLWHKFELWVDGTVHTLPSDGSSAATYLFRTVAAAQPVTVNAGIGSDDGVELWLNGEKIHSKDVARGVSPNQDRVPLPLRAGENTLLMKIYNNSGEHGFYFSITDDPVYAVWDLMEKDFPRESAWVRRDLLEGVHITLLNGADASSDVKRIIASAAGSAGELEGGLKGELVALDAAAIPGDDPRWLDLYAKACKIRDDVEALDPVNFAALRRAINDLTQSYPEGYARGPEFLGRLDAYEQSMPTLMTAMAVDPDAAWTTIEEIRAFQVEALLANPLLDFDRLLLVKRGENAPGLPQNWQGNCAIASRGYDNEIAVLSPVRPGSALTTFYRPENGAFVGDVDLDFDADKLLFSMPGSHERWQIWEIQADGAGLRQVTPGEEPDIDNYDPCYLPDGKIMFASTRCVAGVPCVGGGNTVANMCRMDADGQNARQLSFDQDHNWCPTVLNNGRVLYSRWEYSDTPHYFSRLLFHMNPDGTNQAEYYGSNSYWPNSTFYARPIPGNPTAVVAIISGHHGVPRMGELVVFDPAKSRFEGDGLVQRIPGFGQKVEPVIMDTLVDSVWPRFLHPYPLSGKYFLVSCKPTASAPWGIYLVDLFDNMTLLKEVPGYSLFEPVPFRKTARPPVIPDRVKLDRQDATVYLTDVYAGQGLKGVPRGTIKSLRVYEFYYTYPQMGGHINIGVEGPWDVHRILGTAPVYEDGSAYFKIPANIPIAVQPLDADGRAVQIMRSWFVGMPGEAVSCVGCHERQNMTPAPVQTIAARLEAVELTPWKGPARGFSFKRDVQPVLDKFCVGCHDGNPRTDGRTLPDFSPKERNGWNNFTRSYLALHPYVRRPGPESDYHLQKPAEFHASTSELVQMLEKGHHGVRLDADAWDRIYTWIDLNVPDHGTWGEHHEIPGNFHQRRIEMRTRYANRPEDPESIPDLPKDLGAPVVPEDKPAPPAERVACDGWPFDAEHAAGLQANAGQPARRTLDLGNGVTMDLALIPAGEYLMGSAEGPEDERPMSKVNIAAPFWMGVVEVTNAQYQQFDPRHDSGFIDQHNKDHTTPGYSVQAPNNPVIRVTWEEAMAFCRWLSEKAGQPCSLPNEAQWEWACRAGSDQPFWYGGLDTDFSACANLADESIRQLAVAGINPQPIPNPSRFEDFLPKEDRFNDGCRIVTETGKYQPNPWGLCDMHGNVAEWTLSTYRPYPFVAADGRDDATAPGKKVVRGGSWFDRPKRARASYRLAYDPWQPVYNVGFRVVIPAQDRVAAAR